MENLKQKEGIEFYAMPENPNQNKGIEYGRDGKEPKIKKEGIESGCDAREPESKQRDRMCLKV